MEKRTPNDDAGPLASIIDIIGVPFLLLPGL